MINARTRASRAIKRSYRYQDTRAVRTVAYCKKSLSARAANLHFFE